MGFLKRGESPKGEYVRLLMCCWRTACWAAEAFGSVNAFYKRKEKARCQSKDPGHFEQENSKLFFKSWSSKCSDSLNDIIGGE